MQFSTLINDPAGLFDGQALPDGGGFQAYVDVSPDPITGIIRCKVFYDDGHGNGSLAFEFEAA